MRREAKVMSLVGVSFIFLQIIVALNGFNLSEQFREYIKQMGVN